jgi:hypothetical protein
LPQRLLDARDRGGVPLDQRLDPAVVQVAHPAGDAFALRRLLDEPAEPDALDASTDQEAPRNHS